MGERASCPFPHERPTRQAICSDNQSVADDRRRHDRLHDRSRRHHRRRRHDRRRRHHRRGRHHDRSRRGNGRTDDATDNSADKTRPEIAAAASPEATMMMMIHGGMMKTVVKRPRTVVKTAVETMCHARAGAQNGCEYCDDDFLHFFFPFFLPSSAFTYL